MFCLLVFFFYDPAATTIYTLSLHDALPIYGHWLRRRLASLDQAEPVGGGFAFRMHVTTIGFELTVKIQGAARSEEHTSELQSHSDLVCRLLLEKKNRTPLPALRLQQTYPTP